MLLMNLLSKKKKKEKTNVSFDNFSLSILLKSKKEGKRKKRSEEFKEFEVKQNSPGKTSKNRFCIPPSTSPRKESKLHAPFFPFPKKKLKKKKKEQRIHKARNLEKML